METSPYFATQVQSYLGFCFAVEMERKTLTIVAFMGKWRKSN